MSATHFLNRAVWFALLVSTLSVPAWSARSEGASQHSLRPISAEVLPGGVVWTAKAAFTGATLILRGPEGRTARRDFPAGASIRLAFEDLGPAPAEGSYLWEVRLVPPIPADVEDSLREAAELNQTRRTVELNARHGLRHRDLLAAGRFQVRAGRFEADGDDAAPESGPIDRAVSRPGERGPLNNYDVSGSWTVTGDLGIGTDFPVRELDIVGGDPAIRLHDSTNASSWFINADEASFDVRRDGNGTMDSVLSLDSAAPKPSIVVDSAGDWGNGTSLPSASLHVSRADGTAKILVEDDAPTVARRTLFELENNGGISFRFLNTNTGANWFFTQDSADNFAVSLSGTGGPELLVRGDGRVEIGPGAATVFNLAPGGNLTIGGVLTELSDREAKENFEPVDGGEILEKVLSLPLSSWSLKADPDGSRHLGPTAQDFRAVFGLGADARHISGVDRSGVALAAIQGLNQQLRRREAELEALRAQVESQARQIRELMAGWESLKSGRGER